MGRIRPALIYGRSVAAGWSATISAMAEAAIMELNPSRLHHYCSSSIMGAYIITIEVVALIIGTDVARATIVHHRIIRDIRYARAKCPAIYPGDRHRAMASIGGPLNDRHQWRSVRALPYRSITDIPSEATWHIPGDGNVRHRLLFSAYGDHRKWGTGSYRSPREFSSARPVRTICVTLCSAGDGKLFHARSRQQYIFVYPSPAHLDYSLFTFIFSSFFDSHFIVIFFYYL